MKRSMWVVGVAVALMAAIVLPSSAAGDNNRHRCLGSNFSLVGEVAGVDVGAGTLTVEVHTGSRIIQDLEAEQVVVTTDESTLFLRHLDTTCEVITLDDIVVGDWVSVSGRVATINGDQLLLAERITVDAPLHTAS
jgi:hypothetical protein